MELGQLNDDARTDGGARGAGLAARSDHDEGRGISMFTIGAHTMVVADPEMLRLYAQIERLSRTQLPVLISGESGVGKEHAALAVHGWSGRRTRPFVPLHCAALQDALLEAELFGYERGAFLGAVNGKPGLLERADRGTLFLDEVSGLSATAQARLLRVLEDQRATRLGGIEERTLDLRIVAATSCDLAAEVAAGRFRGDLYFRLTGAILALPPLRARRRDIAALAQHFLAQAYPATEYGRVEISPAAMQRLEAHPWTGNVRELESVVARHAVAGEIAALPPAGADVADGGFIDRLLDRELPITQGRELLIEHFERRYVARVLKRHEHIGEAAAASGLAPRYFRTLKAKYGYGTK
jgi:DNA-binding NtrC family response regulator